MNTCPGCSNELESGYVELKQRLTDTLTHGWSYLLLSYAGSEISDMDVLKPEERLCGGFCPRCGVIVILQEPWTL